MTAETILVQSKGFYKTEKTLQNVPRGEQTGGGTEHPRSGLAKVLIYSSCSWLGDSQKLVLQGSHCGGKRQGGGLPRTQQSPLDKFKLLLNNSNYFVCVCVCSRGLSKYEKDRESFWHRHLKEDKSGSLTSLSKGAIFFFKLVITINQKNVSRW